MFVTTANPELEPPILTVNTVLSLLAMEYPANKLACYVSDDSASPVTFYALVEASKFAKLWVPFCKKYDVAVRAPFRYFNGDHTSPPESSREFRREWKKMNVNIFFCNPSLQRIVTVNLILVCKYNCRMNMQICVERSKMPPKIPSYSTNSQLLQILIEMTILQS